MVVYADVLVTVNLIVDFILLKITLKILKLKVKPLRIILASALGAIFSLYIFFPSKGILFELVIKLFMAVSMVLVCNGFVSLKRFLGAIGVLFAVTCSFGGIMIALWQILKPKGMIINNSVVYFNISPVVLIIFTVLGYFLYLGFSKIFSPAGTVAKRCEISISADSKSVSATAILDTGNSLKDIFSESEIIIGDKSLLLVLFGTTSPENTPHLQSRFRTIPCHTVTGTEILTGFRCDKAKIILPDKILFLKNPILVASKTPIKEDYSAILNPKITELQGEQNETENITL